MSTSFVPGMQETQNIFHRGSKGTKTLFTGKDKPELMHCLVTFPGSFTYSMSDDSCNVR